MSAERPPRISRRAMLRSLAAGLSALGIAPLLGACGQGTPDDASSAATAVPVEAPATTTTPQNTITVWFNNVSINETIHAFKRANPTIDVDVKLFGDAEQGLLRTLESGIGLPDVCIFSSGYAGALAQRGGLLPLSEAPFDAAALKDDFVAAAWNSALDEQNKLIGMPLSVYPGTFWYRADVLDAAGVESDPEKLKQQITDWPALFAFAKAYTDKHAESSLLPRAFFDVFMPQLIQQGGGLAEKSKLLIEEKCTQPAEQALLVRTLNLDLPALRTAWTDPLYDAPVGFFGGQRVYREWARIAESAQMLATNPYDLAIYDALNIAVRKVVDQELDAETALQGVEQQLMKANPGLTA